MCKNILQMQFIKELKKRHILVLNLHIILLILTCLIYLNQWISPKYIEYFEYLAMCFPLFFIFHLLFCAYWLFFKRKLLLYFVFASIVVIPTFLLWFNFTSIKTSNDELKVVNYNVYYGKKRGIDSIETYIKNQKPDIVLLQEIWSRQWKKEDNLLTDYYNAVFPFVGISSKHPIIDKKEINLYNTNGHACWADIVVKEDTIRAFSIYLEPIYLTKNLFKFKTKEEFDINSKEIQRLLWKGFRTHVDQLQFIKDEIQKSPYPIIVGGDLNAVPNSYEYYQLSSFLNDAFYSKGSGLGTTFHDYFYPIKIDYTFFDDNFEILSSKVDHSIYLSDHFPISTTFRIKKNYEKD